MWLSTVPMGQVTSLIGEDQDVGEQQELKKISKPSVRNGIANHQPDEERISTCRRMVLIYCLRPLIVSHGWTYDFTHSKWYGVINCLKVITNGENGFAKIWTEQFLENLLYLLETKQDLPLMPLSTPITSGNCPRGQQPTDIEYQRNDDHHKVTVLVGFIGTT